MLFNKDTFFPNVNVKSIYLHDTRRETKAGFYRACYHVPLFVDNLSAAKKHSRSCRYTFVTYTLRNVVLGKKLILTIRAVMLDENVDLVAGDFNGAAWRCSNRNNISTIEEAFADCALPMPPSPTPLWGPGSFGATGLAFVDSSNLLNPISSGKFVNTEHSPFSMKLLQPDYLQDPTDPALHLYMKIFLTNIRETLSLLSHIYGETPCTRSQFFS